MRFTPILLLFMAALYVQQSEAKLKCDGLWKSKPENLIYVAAEEYFALQMNGLNGIHGLNKSCIEDNKFTVISPFFNSYSGFSEQDPKRASVNASEVQSVLFTSITSKKDMSFESPVGIKELADIALKARPTDAIINVEGVFELKDKRKEKFSFSMTPVVRRKEWEKYGCFRLVQAIKTDFQQPVDRKLASPSCLHPSAYRLK